MTRREAKLFFAKALLNEWEDSPGEPEIEKAFEAAKILDMPKSIQDQFEYWVEQLN